MTTSEFWQEYLKKTNQEEEDALFSGELLFEEKGITGLEQHSLILSGAKTAMFRAVDAYEINMEPLPISGEIYVVLDLNEEPSSIIEVTDVNIIPFCEIPWDLARRDGENENLSEWQEKMRELISDEADLCGFTFTEDTKIVCEIFRVIYRG